MKKLISLLSAVALFATLLSTVAFADSNNRYYIEESKSGDLLTLHFVLETDQDLASASYTLDIAPAYTNGATVDSYTKGDDAATFNVNTTQKVVSWTVASTDGVTGTLDLGTVVLDLSGATADFTMPVKGTRTLKAKDTGKVDVASSFTDEVSGYAVSIGGGDPEFEVSQDANGIVSFDNYADIDTTNPRYSESDKTPSAILTDNQVKLFTQKFTGVTVNTRFEIGHNGETKTFGWTIGDYFDITGSGALSGSLGVAVIFPKDDPSTDFTITPVNASTLD